MIGFSGWRCLWQSWQNGGNAFSPAGHSEAGSHRSFSIRCGESSLDRTIKNSNLTLGLYFLLSHLRQSKV